MSFSLNAFHRPAGTRFLLYPQSPVLKGFEQPETIWVSSPAGSLGEGPSDGRMYALQPVQKDPYGDKTMPPFGGARQPAVRPDPGGHFDHLEPGDPGFACAHMFGSVRRVLDVWETYLGGPIPWHFAMTHPRLEMIAHVPWDNAHFGWGFMECGEGIDDQGELRQFALNFDILAHETGHGLIFSIVGMPTPETLNASYRGFHESASDCVAMLSALHFERFVAHVLEVTGGDLYRENEMNRIGELSRTRQIRSASNAMTLSDVISVDTPSSEITGKQVHALGQPLTGAVFDILVEFYLDNLVEARLIAAETAQQQRRAAMAARLEQLDTSALCDAYRAEPEGFQDALRDARDMLGLRLGECWRRLTPEGFSFGRVVDGLLEVDAEWSGTRNRQMIVECFEWRGISAGDRHRS